MRCPGAERTMGCHLARLKSKTVRSECGPGVELPDGAEVRLTIPDSASQPSFAERYATYIGVAADLPPDLAANLDHYVNTDTGRNEPGLFQATPGIGHGMSGRRAHKPEPRSQIGQPVAGDPARRLFTNRVDAIDPACGALQFPLEYGSSSKTNRSRGRGERERGGGRPLRLPQPSAIRARTKLVISCAYPPGPTPPRAAARRRTGRRP